jgi:cyclin B
LCDITNVGTNAVQLQKDSFTGLCNSANFNSEVFVGAAPYEYIKPKVPVPSRGETSCSTRTSTPVAMDQMDDEPECPSDPQKVAEYVCDIYKLLDRDEDKHLPRQNYMDDQRDINVKMRAILVDWLVEVHMKYKLKLETLFLTVNLIDRFLDERQTMRKKLQLVGVTAMLIAAKFEEIYPPEVRDFVYITDNAYSKEDILQMEVLMLTQLKFVLCVPTAAHFLERIKQANLDGRPKNDEQAKVHGHLMNYLLELSLLDFKMIRYEPSHLVAAAALLSNRLMKLHPAWPMAMSNSCKHDLPAVKQCAQDMCGILEGVEGSQLKAVRKKFSHDKFSKVASMPWW